MGLSYYMGPVVPTKFPIPQFLEIHLCMKRRKLLVPLTKPERHPSKLNLSRHKAYTHKIGGCTDYTYLIGDQLVVS